MIKMRSKNAFKPKLVNFGEVNTETNLVVLDHQDKLKVGHHYLIEVGCKYVGVLGQPYFDVYSIEVIITKDMINTDFALRIVNDLDDSEELMCYCALRQTLNSNYEIDVIGTSVGDGSLVWIYDLGVSGI